ncbi:MAG: class B sortase [Lachnospiraceae bacterium]|nr:class B sortase [Lachnospiraceae bacterium]
MKKNRSNRRPGVILWLSYITAGVCFLVSVFFLYRIFGDYNRNRQIYQKVKEEYTRPTEETKEEAKEAATPSKAKEPQLQVDLKGLKENYPDVAAWLYIPEVLSYPVMYSGDNERYLDHAYNGQKDKAGSLFLDQNDHPDMTDRHMIIYGHNMKDGSMFGRLKEYLRDRDFVSAHPYFYLYNGKEELRYRIVSCRQVEMTDDVYTVYGKDDLGYETFARKIIGLDDENSNKQTVTLSTCSVTDQRFIITGLQDN